MSESNESKPEQKKQSRRGKGEGLVRKRPNGTWEARIEVGRDVSGKRIRKSVYGVTKKEVTGELTKLASSRLNGSLIQTGKMNVGDLLEKWIEDSARVTCEPGTVQEYRRIVDKHLKPRIGAMKLSALKLLHIQSMLSRFSQLRHDAQDSFPLGGIFLYSLDGTGSCLRVYFFERSGPNTARPPANLPESAKKDSISSRESDLALERSRKWGVNESRTVQNPT